MVNSGRVSALRGFSDSTDWEVSGWQDNVWYRTILTYDKEQGQLSSLTTRLDTGAPVSELNVTFDPFLPADVSRLGVTRLHMEGYTGNAVEYYLDNITLTQQEAREARDS